MAILVGADSRVICQGMTGHAGSYHTQRMIAYGTKIVAGVTPGKGGRRALDLPVFNTVRDAKAATDANASILFVPPLNAAGAMIEAIEAELPLIVCVTERVPVLDMIRVRQALEGSKTRLIGPNSQGILAPGIAQLGVMTTVNARRGSIGIASRSASLTSEVVAQVTAAGLGQSTTVGVGGDPVHGVDLKTCLELFLDDPDTHGIVLIGEIGGTEEEEAAALAARLKPQKTDRRTHRRP
jgi:succinyl-CoA synthetase alpha subunit